MKTEVVLTLGELTEGGYFNRSLREPTLAVIESLEQTTTVIQQLETRKYVQVH